MARATAPHPPNPPKPLAEQPGNPANKLGAWCRSSPGGGTNFQNPNFEISSILALLACLRRFGTLKKNVIPDFTSILALWACLRRFGTLKKRPSPKFQACIQIFEHAFSIFGHVSSIHWRRDDFRPLDTICNDRKSFPTISNHRVIP